MPPPPLFETPVTYDLDPRMSAHATQDLPTKEHNLKPNIYACIVYTQNIIWPPVDEKNTTSPAIALRTSGVSVVSRARLRT